MALKFRRGNNAQKSGSLAFGEPYVNTTLGTLQIGLDTGDVTLQVAGTGSIGTFGAISGSSLDISGNATIGGNLTLGGNITIGDQTTDTVTVTANLSSSLIPSNDNVFDLGSSNKRYRDAYIGRNLKIDGNTTLGNGTDDTISFSGSVNSNILPWTSSFIDAGAQFDLGSRTQPWRHIYVATGSIYFVGANGNIASTMSVSNNGLALDGDMRVSGSIYGSSTTSSIYMRGNAEFSGSVSASTFTGLGNLTAYSTSVASRLGLLEIETANLESFTSSINTTIKTRLNAETVISGSSQVLGGTGIVSGAAQITPLLPTGTVSGSSQVSYTSLSNIPAGIVSGAAQVTPLLPTGTVSGSSQVVGILSSLNSYTASNDTTNTTQNSRLDQLSTESGSVRGRLNNLETTSASVNSSINAINTLTASASGRLTSIESYTSSLRTAITVAGSDVTVNGNLTVSGTTTQINSTTVNIGDNIIQLNGTGATNAGLVVRDATGATTTSGSFLWDTTNDKWIAGPLGSEQDVVLNAASQTLTNKTINGTNNTITNIANASLVNSAITIAGTSVSLGGSITAATILQGTGVVSGSSQVTYASLSGIPAGIVSGAAQVTPLLPTGTVSGSSQITYASISSIPAGIVSGSAQVNHNATTNYVANQHIDHTTVSMTAGNGLSGGGDISTTRTLTLDTASAHFISGSRNLISVSDTTGASGIDLTYTATTGVLSGVLVNSAITIAGTSTSLGGSITLATITGGSGIVSGSSQITYSGLTGIPAGIVSGAAQVTPLLPTGTVSGSSQVSYTGLSNIPAGIVSGAAQVTPLLPTGTVSGSGQVSITGTSGYDANRWVDHTAVSITAGSGLSGGGTIASTRTLTLDTASAHFISGSRSSFSAGSGIAITLGSIAASGITTSNLAANAGITNAQLANSAITIAGTSTSLGGTITLATITGGSGILSGSGQLPTGVVSGSSQITYSGITGIPAGIVSGAAQVTPLLPTGTVSGSSQVVSILTSLNSYTASNDTKWSTLGSLSGSFARTNSANIFTGDQTITGSLYVSANLIVQGSSSIQNISSSTLNIGTNLVTVAVNQPSVRFGGLAVIDSGSSGGSGSFLYDSVEDEFIFVHRGDGINITSSHFVLGPETYNNLGNETYLTNNRLPKGTGKEHLVDSNITDSGTLITLGSNTQVNGTFFATGTPLVSGSAQISGTGITNNTITIAGTSTALGGTITLATITGNSGIISGSGQIAAVLPTGVVSGSSQLTASYDLRYETQGRGIVSGAAQVTPLLPTGTVSGSSQVVGILASLNTYTGSNDTTNTAQNARLNALEVQSGSDLGRLNNLETTSASVNTSLSNINTFTGSANGRLNNLETFTSSINTTIKNQLNANTVISGSSQVTGITNSQLVNSTITIAGTSTALGGSITLATITGASGIVSGSSQVTYSGLTGIPAGIVSGAAQVTPLLPTGTISGSAQVNGTQISNNTITIAGTSTALGGSITLATITGASGIVSSSAQVTPLLPTGVVSGSSQITYSSISGISAGIVSGAAQITPLLPTGTVSGSSQVVGILSSLNTFSGSTNSRLSALETQSGSDLGRLNSIESYTSSLRTALTVSGTDVTLNGNLTVAGTTTTINSTTLQIADNIIQLNGTGATNAGLVVRDATAATTTSGSLLWDTTLDKWIAGPLGSEQDVVLNAASQTLTNKTISGASNTLSNIANASLTNSSITIAGTAVSLGSSITLATITGGSGIVSGSGQVTYSSLSGIPAGIVSGAAQITPLLPTGVVSGSSQVNGTAITNNTITIAGTSTALGGSITLATITGASGIVSGSTQVTPLLPTGTVSGSSQISHTATTGYVANQHIDHTTVSITAGSGLTGGGDISATRTLSVATGGVTNAMLANSAITIAGTSTSLGGSITLATITNGSGIVSGSSQITYSSLSGIPAGIVSGAAQVTPLLPTGTISGSAQVNGTAITNNTITIAGTSTALGGSITLATITGASGIVSGSSQVTALLPTGVVSGSSQVLSGGTNNVIPRWTGANSLGTSNISQVATTGKILVAGGIGSSSALNTQFEIAGAGENPDINYLGFSAGYAPDPGTTGQLALPAKNRINSYTFQQGVSGSAILDIAALATQFYAGNGGYGGAFATDRPIVRINANGLILSGSSTAFYAEQMPSATSNSPFVVYEGGQFKQSTVGLALRGTGIVSGSSQITGLTTSNLSATAGITNAQLANSSVTVTAGTGMSGGGTVALGSSITLTNAGVTSNVAGSGISVSGATGAVTITNTGVRSIAAGTGVSVSATTGDSCTISIGQAIGTTNSPTFAGLTINGSITATGDITAFFSSDKRFKNNIQTIPNALDKVKKLNGVTWDWNEDVDDVMKQAPTTGLIAQEVQEVLPQVVKEREDGHLGLDYSKMMGLLVEAIKEQQIKIDNLTIELTELKKQKGL